MVAYIAKHISYSQFILFYIYNQVSFQDFSVLLFQERITAFSVYFCIFVKLLTCKAPFNLEKKLNICWQHQALIPVLFSDGHTQCHSCSQDQTAAQQLQKQLGVVEAQLPKAQKHAEFLAFKVPYFDPLIGIKRHLKSFQSTTDKQSKY